MPRTNTKIAQFLRWIEETGSVTRKQIIDAGWKTVFSGQTRQRILACNAILIEDAQVERADKPGLFATVRHYKIGPSSYVPKQSGRRTGYKMQDDAKQMMQIRSAITVLRKHGYMIVPPQGNFSG